METNLKFAGLPYRQRLDEFEFDAQPSIDPSIDGTPARQSAWCRPVLAIGLMLPACARTQGPAAKGPEMAPSPMTSVIPAPKSALLRASLQLSYIDGGDPRSRDVLVLLPGMSDSLRSWELVLPHLPTSLRVIAVSQRGHGDSDKPDNGYSIRDYARDLDALLDALGVTSVVVAGHSSASLVARRFAIEHRARTAGLVLEGSFVRLPPAAAEAAGRLSSALADPIDPDFVREFVAGTIARPVDASFVDAMVAESLEVPARVWRETIRSLIDYDDAAELVGLDVPTLIVWGESDAIIDRDATEELARAIRSASQLTYNGVGHTPHWEVPELFARDVAAFVVACGHR